MLQTRCRSGSNAIQWMTLDAKPSTTDKIYSRSYGKITGLRNEMQKELGVNLHKPIVFQLFPLNLCTTSVSWLSCQKHNNPFTSWRQSKYFIDVNFKIYNLTKKFMYDLYRFCPFTDIQNFICLRNI